MIVIDASAMVELLIGDDERAERVRSAAVGESLSAPHAIDLECASVLRGLVNSRKLAEETADQALASLQQSNLDRYQHTWYLPRIWELRANMWPYDAAYAALAQALRVPLLTVDEKFAKTPGVHCEVIAFKAD